MVDDQAEYPAAPRPNPLVRQQREGERITATRNGNGQDRLGLERREGRHQGREIGRRQGQCDVAHPQPFFWRSWWMRRFCKSVARG